MREGRFIRRTCEGEKAFVDTASPIGYVSPHEGEAGERRSQIGFTTSRCELRPLVMSVWLKDYFCSCAGAGLQRVVQGSDRLSSVFVLPDSRTVHGHSRWHSRVQVEPHVFLRFLNSYCFHGHWVVRDCFISSQLSYRVTIGLTCSFVLFFVGVILCCVTLSFFADILSLKFPMSDFCIC